MKISDIEEYEMGENCFGPFIIVNGKDYDDISKEEKIELINDFLANDLNGDVLLHDFFKEAIMSLGYKCVEEDSSTCDQCGNWNSYEWCVKDG